MDTKDNKNPTMDPPPTYESVMKESKVADRENSPAGLDLPQNEAPSESTVVIIPESKTSGNQLPRKMKTTVKICVITAIIIFLIFGCLTVLGETFLYYLIIYFL